MSFLSLVNRKPQLTSHVVTSLAILGTDTRGTVVQGTSLLFSVALAKLTVGRDYFSHGGFKDTPRVSISHHRSANLTVVTFTTVRSKNQNTVVAFFNRINLMGKRRVNITLLWQQNSRQANSDYLHLAHIWQQHLTLRGHRFVAMVKCRRLLAWTSHPVTSTQAALGCSHIYVSTRRLEGFTLIMCKSE